MKVKEKKYIIIEKYKVKLFGVKIFYYNIILNNSNKMICENPMKMKKKKVLKSIFDRLRFLDPLFKKKKFKKKIYKNDKNIMKNIFKLFDKRHKYTYCLNNDNLLISTTKVKKSNSIIKNTLSKHIILCSDNPCCSGEMVFYKKKEKKYMVFDNNSGTYTPTRINLLQLKKSLYFLNTIIVETNENKHKNYFKPL